MHDDRAGDEVARDRRATAAHRAGHDPHDQHGGDEHGHQARARSRRPGPPVRSPTSRSRRARSSISPWPHSGEDDHGGEQREHPHRRRLVDAGVVLEQRRERTAPRGRRRRAARRARAGPTRTPGASRSRRRGPAGRAGVRSRATDPLTRAVPRIHGDMTRSGSGRSRAVSQGRRQPGELEQAAEQHRGEAPHEQAAHLERRARGRARSTAVNRLAGVEQVGHRHPHHPLDLAAVDDPDRHRVRATTRAPASRRAGSGQVQLREGREHLDAGRVEPDLLLAPRAARPPTEPSSSGSSRPPGKETWPGCERSVCARSVSTTSSPPRGSGPKSISTAERRPSPSGGAKVANHSCSATSGRGRATACGQPRGRGRARAVVGVIGSGLGARHGSVPSGSSGSGPGGGSGSAGRRGELVGAAACAP